MATQTERVFVALDKIADTLDAMPSTPGIVAYSKDGRAITQVDEDELDTDLYFQLQALTIADPKTGKVKMTIPDAMRWLMQKLFLIDGQPLTFDHLCERPPVGIGFRAAAKLSQLAGEFMSGLPDPKQSSESASTPDGD